MDEAIHEALTDYVRKQFAPEDDLLQRIRAESAEQGFPQIHVRPEEGRMLQFLLLAVGAKKVAEIGTLAGYSGTWMARALPPDGRLISLEKEPEHAELARSFFAQAGLNGRAEVRVGAAPDGLKLLEKDAPFDAIFIDADKRGYPAYLDWAIDHVRVGGLVMGHNAFQSGRIVDGAEKSGRSVQAILTFNRRVAEDPRLEGMIIPIGDGIAAGIRVQ